MSILITQSSVSVINFDVNRLWCHNDNKGSRSDLTKYASDNILIYLLSGTCSPDKCEILNCCFPLNKCSRVNENFHTTVISSPPPASILCIPIYLSSIWGYSSKSAALPRPTQTPLSTFLSLPLILSSIKSSFETRMLRLRLIKIRAALPSWPLLPGSVTIWDYDEA